MRPNLHGHFMVPFLIYFHPLFQLHSLWLAVVNCEDLKVYQGIPLSDKTEGVVAVVNKSGLYFLFLD